ncbi:MAG: tyrosine-type recombinase/integrase, partial [Oscillospiraceae bacterium]|nr:tyrosine-type recombinase/integrase [Oscillospiraceae bacterium]
IHQFRHLNATLLINSGTDARTVSSALGHSQVSTTLNIYTHTFAEAQARAGETLADVLEKKVGSA